MKVKSIFTGKEYDPQKTVRIVNTLQLAAYIANDVELLDLFVSRDIKTGKHILVGVVDKEASYEAYQKWCNHELS